MDEEAEVAAVAAVEVLVAAVARGRAADFRLRAECRAVLVWGHVRRHVRVPAAAHGLVAVRWLAPDQGAVRLVVPGPAALLAQVRGLALPEVESRKAVPDPVELVLAAESVKVVRAPAADCQDKALVSGSDPVDPVAISLAVVQRRGNSITFSILDLQPARLEQAAGSEPVRRDVRALPRCPAGADGPVALGGPAGQQPTSCKAADHRSCRLAARH